MSRLATQARRGGFTFDKIPGLAIWLEADKIPGLTDGAAVATWPDASGKGINATQATSGARPIGKTGANGINGYPIVRGDGVDDFLATAADSRLDFSHTNGFTYAAVLRVPADGGRGFWGKTTSGFAGGYDWYSSPTTGDQEWACRGSSLLFSGAGHGTDLRDNVARVLTGWVDSDEMYLYADGTNFRNTTGSWGSTAASSDGFCVFARESTGGAGTQFGKVDIACLALWSPALTGPEHTAVRKHLGAKYGITVA